LALVLLLWAEPPDPAAPSAFALDTITPCVFLARSRCAIPTPRCPYWETPSDSRAESRPVLDSNGVLANLENLTKARDLYRLAEYYHRAGRLETASTFYHEAHTVCPNCRFGILAIKRLNQLDVERAEAVAEEAGHREALGKKVAGSGFDTDNFNNWQVSGINMSSCFDLDCHNGLRFRCEIPLGAVRVRVQYDSWSAALTIRVP
jgi:hypothetical protein